MSKQIKTNNWNYLNNSIFNRVNRLFVVSFEDEDDGTSFSKYRTPSVEIKDFNVLIESKSFFWCSNKIKEETYEANTEMSKTYNYTTGNLLDYENGSKHYKLNAIDLIKQTELKDPL